MGVNKLLINQISDRRQRRFVELMTLKKVSYLRKTDADIAVEAGYSPASAYAQASRLLRKDHISDAIAELCDRMWEKESMSAREMISLLTKRARFDPKRFVRDDGTFDIVKLKADDTVIVDEISMVRDTVRVKSSAIPAMTLMARITGILDAEGDTSTAEAKAKEVVKLIGEIRGNTAADTPDELKSKRKK